jgi:hypothetical protein
VEEHTMFFWGAFGALLPQIIELHGSSMKIDLLASIRQGIISVVYAIAAGIFTIAWGPETAFKAIWVGISFPVLVSSLMRHLPPAHHTLSK